jgi:hypothetical protein
MPALGRAQLVTHIHDRLINRTAPRLELFLIVSLAGAAAFVTSVGGLRLGLESMAWRYPLAVAAGYGTFLLLIRIWIAWQRRRLTAHGALDALDVASDLWLERPDASGIARDEVPLFEAGRSGGGGGGSSFESQAWVTPSRTAAGRSSGGGIDLDWDELWPLAVAIACVIGGAVAIAAVMYTAPVLLAEVALDAAIMSAVYRRLRREDASHWVMTVVRKTWLPALTLVLLGAIAGYALQQIAPEARSIGGVISGIQR